MACTKLKGYKFVIWNERQGKDEEKEEEESKDQTRAFNQKHCSKRMVIGLAHGYIHPAAAPASRLVVMLKALVLRPLINELSTLWM